MATEVSIKDTRAARLDYDLHARSGAELLEGFFGFSVSRKNFIGTGALAQCFISDIHIARYVSDWPHHPPPPHPGIFEDFFPDLLRRLVGPGNTLTLFVRGVERDHFDELGVIQSILVPQGLRYVLLARPQLKADPRLRLGVGNLVFEWPLASLDFIVTHWFQSPVIEIEGYISPDPPLGRIADLYFQPDTEDRIRELLRSITVGFRLWPDNNGLLVLSDKLDEGALRERFRVSEPLPPGPTEGRD